MIPRKTENAASSEWCTLAATHQAWLFLVEHRYYGQSRMTESVDGTSWNFTLFQSREDRHGLPVAECGSIYRGFYCLHPDDERARREISAGQVGSHGSLICRSVGTARELPPRDNKKTIRSRVLLVDYTHLFLFWEDIRIRRKFNARASTGRFQQRGREDGSLHSHQAGHLILFLLIFCLILVCFN